MPSQLVNEAMEPKSVSIKQLIDRIKRHPMLQVLSEEAIIDYCVDFFKIVGLPNALEDKTALIKIKNNRGLLPEDFLEMTQVRGVNCYYTEFNPEKNYNKGAEVYYNNKVWVFVEDHQAGIWNPNQVVEGTIRGEVYHYRYSTDTFHLSSNHINSVPFTYKIQGSVIYTSNPEGFVEIAYQAIEVDECGLPVIPDDAKFMRALQAYIKVEHFGVLFDEGKIDPRIMERAEREYCFAVGACESEFHMLSLDKAESVANMAKALIGRDMEHYRGYATSGNKELLRIH